MQNTVLYIAEQFRGKFIKEAEGIKIKLLRAKVFVFDWDGVFNDGMKDEKGSSPYSEIDAMGTNMLRFNHYLRAGHNPVFAIVSGESNKAAFSLAEREHFHAVYYGIRHKVTALEHICKSHSVKPEEVVFVFDDVLDFSMAAKCGIRIMVARSKSNPLLLDFAVEHKLVDYMTANDGGNHAVRETVELLTGLSGLYDDTLKQRMNFTDKYQQYLKLRNTATTRYYTAKDTEITEQIPS